MQWLKVTLIMLMLVSIPIEAAAAFMGPNHKTVIPYSSEKVDEGKLKYRESKAILMRVYPLVKKLNNMTTDLEKIVFNKNREDKDFYPMLVTSQEVRNIMYLLDHCITMSVYLIHIKSDSYSLFLRFSLEKVHILMKLVNLGKTVMKVDFNFISDEKFIEKSKEVLEIITKIQEVEEDFFDRLAL